MTIENWLVWRCCNGRWQPSLYHRNPPFTPKEDKEFVRVHPLKTSISLDEAVALHPAPEVRDATA